MKTNTVKQLLRIATLLTALVLTAVVMTLLASALGVEDPSLTTVNEEVNSFNLTVSVPDGMEIGYSSARVEKVNTAHIVNLLNYEEYPFERAYKITNVEGFQKLDEMIQRYDTFSNITIYLANDVDFSNVEGFTPIGWSSQKETVVNKNPSRAFQGVFDGQGHMVTGLYMTMQSSNYTDASDTVNYGGVSFFGILVNATVKNLIVDGSFSYVADPHDHGCAAGIAFASYNTTFDNCMNLADIYNESRFAAGIVARPIGTVSIKNCTNAGNVTACQAAGGIVGMGMATEISGCRNVGDITCIKNYGMIDSQGVLVGSDHSAAGIIAWQSRSGNISNCINSGTIVGIDNVASIVGQVGKEDGTGSPISISGCVGYGTLSLQDAKYQYTNGDSNIPVLSSRGTVWGEVHIDDFTYTNNTDSRGASDPTLQYTSYSPDFTEEPTYEIDYTYQPYNADQHQCICSCGEITYAAHTISNGICEDCGMGLGEKYDPNEGFMGFEHIFCLDHIWDEGKAIIAPTCTEEGSMLYTCTRCGKTKAETVSALGHTPADEVEENYLGASCTENGSYDLVVYCLNCGTELSREAQTISALGHTPGDAVEENRVEAGCTEDGSYDLAVYCLICGTELSREAHTISALGHTPGEAVEENRVEATCTEDGSYDLAVYCLTCGTELSREAQTISAFGHTPGGTVAENHVAATCTEDGSYDLAVYCLTCCTELSREAQTISAYGHTPGEAVEEKRVEATCTEDGGYHLTVYCSACGEKLSQQIFMIPANGHTPGAAVEENRMDSTCQATGSYDSVVYCLVCAREISRISVEIPVGDHTYSNGICLFCGVWDGITKFATFDGVNLFVGKDITVKYYVTIYADLPNIKLTFKMGDKTANVIGVPTGIADQYVFAFEGVSPQCMGDAITAELYSGTNLIAEKGAYTVKAYLEYLINGNYDGKTKAVAKDTLIYGGAAQVYKNYNTDAIVSDGITGSSYILPEKSGILLSNGAGATFTNATVWFDNINKLRVKFTADSTENLVVKINGTEVEYVLGNDGKYSVHTDALYATEFDEFFTFEIYINSTLVSTLKYSVNSYVYTMLSSSNEAMKNLAIALYNYGYSADIYNGTPQTPMISEEEAAKADPTKGFMGEAHVFS